MKHKVGDMFIRLDFEKREGVVFRIAAVDDQSYQIICHDGSWWCITDEDISSRAFRKIWTAEMDNYISFFYAT